MENNQQQISDKIIKQINSSFDFKRLLGAIMAGWYWFVLALSITLTAGFLYLRYTTPIYQIKSSMMIDESNDESGAKNVLSKMEEGGKGPEQSTNLYNEMFILRSQDLVQKVVDSLALNIRYWSIGRVKQTELYQDCPIKIVFDTGGMKSGYTEFIVKQVVDGQFEIKEGKMTERVLYDSWVKRPFGRFKIIYTSGPHVNRGYLQGTPFIIRIESVSGAVSRILGAFSVNTSDARTSLLDLAYTDNIPQRGVDFMNVLIFFYQKKELENINRSAEKTREFINQRKASMIQDLHFMDTTEENIKLNNDIISPLSQTDQFLAEKTASEDKVNELLAEKETLNMLRRQVQNNSDQVITAMGVEDVVLTTMIGQYNTLIQQYEEYQKNYGPANPYLLKTQSDIASLRKRILEAIDRIMSSINVSLQNASSNVREYNSRMRSVPSIDRSIKDATREYDVLQSMYLYLYQKGVENEISVYAAGNKSKVVVVPFSSGAPIQPVPKTAYSMMFLIGLLIPGTVIIVREMLNHTVINENDIESLTQIPVIGSVTRVENAAVGESVIVVGPHVRTGVAEQFRLIRANLEFMSSSSGKKVFMVTSSRSGEGKSFVSINLGITMTLAKKRVVIMEFDLRKPQITNQLGLSNNGGISSYLAGFTDLDSVIKASGIHENLYIANCGPIPPNPGELLVLPTTAELIGRLQDMFDVVIIDTAPIGLVSDALILSQYASINVFIIRQSLTVKDQVRMFDVLYKDKKILHPCIIFNGVLYLKKYGYGYGGGKYAYGYSYGQGYYGQGYYEDDKKAKKGNAFTRFFMK